MDLEPDYPQQNFKNVTFKDCISRNNTGPGFIMALKRLNSSSNPLSINVVNLTVDGTRTSDGIAVTGIPPGLMGTINVSNSSVKDVRGASGIFNKSPLGAYVRFESCTFENVATCYGRSELANTSCRSMTNAKPLMVYGSGLLRWAWMLKSLHATLYIALVIPYTKYIWRRQNEFNVYGRPGECLGMTLAAQRLTTAQSEIEGAAK